MGFSQRNQGQNTFKENKNVTGTPKNRELSPPLPPTVFGQKSNQSPTGRLKETNLAWHKPFFSAQTKEKVLLEQVKATRLDVPLPKVRFMVISRPASESMLGLASEE